MTLPVTKAGRHAYARPAGQDSVRVAIPSTLCWAKQHAAANRGNKQHEKGLLLATACCSKARAARRRQNMLRLCTQTFMGLPRACIISANHHGSSANALPSKVLHPHMTYPIIFGSLSSAKATYAAKYCRPRHCLASHTAVYA